MSDNPKHNFLQGLHTCGRSATPPGGSSTPEHDFVQGLHACGRNATPSGGLHDVSGIRQFKTCGRSSAPVGKDACSSGHYSACRVSLK